MTRVHPRVRLTRYLHVLHVEDDTQAVQVGPEPDPTRDYTQHHHIPVCGDREGPCGRAEASPWPGGWSDSELGYE